ncbi:MAG TPA: hypothetical protein VFU23_11290 [Gemmatimonadales bacterium]|nr:hypothetical protein [Gemmatimonadales bacterium]
MTEPDRGRALPPGPSGGLPEHGFYFYILATPGRELLLGVTKDLVRCLCQLRGSATLPGSRAPLSAARLVYFEIVSDLQLAFRRKEQLEGWNRRKKWRLIVSANPTCKDLSVHLVQRK